MRKTLPFGAVLIGLIIVIGCKRSAKEETSEPAATQAPNNGGTQSDDSAPADREKDADAQAGGENHAHDETPLGKFTIGDLEVELAQGHGKVQAGKEGHLVIKLPYNDKGATIVRAWIGTEDRTASAVAKAEYAPSHDDYDVHAVAPEPLPEDVKWWIEIEKPDGTKLVGNATPLIGD